MDIRRVILYAALALVVYSLWMNWQVDYPHAFQQAPAIVKSSDKIPTDGTLLPTGMIDTESA